MLMVSPKKYSKTKQERYLRKRATTSERLVSKKLHIQLLHGYHQAKYKSGMFLQRLFPMYGNLHLIPYPGEMQEIKEAVEGQSAEYAFETSSVSPSNVKAGTVGDKSSSVENLVRSSIYITSQ
jgi:hypothetical protein